LQSQVFIVADYPEAERSSHWPALQLNLFTVIFEDLTVVKELACEKSKQ